MLITQVALLHTTPTIIYRCGPEQQLMIHHCLMSNGENNINTIQAFLVPEGQSPGLNNQVLYNYKLSANSFIEILREAIIDVNHALYAQSNDDNFVTCYVCGELIVATQF